MTDFPAFTGFPSTTLQFLADLAANNNRDWFQAHRPEYEAAILAPVQEFVLALGSRLQVMAPGVQYDPATNGSGSMMRIYRDIRFAKDKTPYKTHVGIIFWEGPGKKTETPAFYFGLDATGAGLHVGLHNFTRPFRLAYREAVADVELGGQLSEILAQIRAAGPYEIGGEHYKRVPRGFDPDHPRADLLRHDGLWASAPGLAPAQVTSPGLVDTVLDHCRHLAPLQQWLVTVAGLQARFT